MIKNIIRLPNGTEIASGSDAISVMSFEHYETVNNGTELTAGSACTSYISAAIHTPENRFDIPYGTELEYWVDHDGEKNKIGLYTIEKPSNPSRNTLKFTAYDRMVWFDVDITDVVMTTDFSGMTLHGLLQWLCDLVGIRLKNNSIPNGDYILDDFSMEITARKLLEYIAEVACSFARITVDGLLELAWYTDRYFDNYQIGPSVSAQSFVELADGETLQTINSERFVVSTTRSAYFNNSLTYDGYEVRKPEKVLIINNADDVGVVYPDIVGNTYTILGNPLMANLDPNRLKPVAKTIFERLQLSYTPIKVSIPNSFDLRPGDLVGVEDANGNRLKSIVMSCRRKGQKMTIQSSGSESRSSTTNINRLEFKDIASKLFQVSTSVHGLQTVAKDQSGKLAQLEQTVDGFKLTVRDKDGQTSLVLESGSAELASLAISLLGVVTFSNLSRDGETVINGGNITTGRISSKNGDSYIDLDTGVGELTGQLKTKKESYLIGDKQYYAVTGIEPDNIYSHLVDENGETYNASIISRRRFSVSNRKGSVIIQSPQASDYNLRCGIRVSEQDVGSIDIQTIPETNPDPAVRVPARVQIQLFDLTYDEEESLTMYSQNGRRCLTGLTHPINDSDAVNKAYVDKLFAQLNGG